MRVDSVSRYFTCITDESLIEKMLIAVAGLSLCRGDRNP